MAQKWLGYLDSNQGVTESKSVALPLGYTPMRLKNGGGGRIRTAEPEGTDLQSVVFSHFTTPPDEDGAGERSRTLDLLITSQLLYQLSYTGNKYINGGSGRNRTADTRIFSPLLYRLSY